MNIEAISLWAALIAYVISGIIAIVILVLSKQSTDKQENIILALMFFGVLLHTASIGLRWERLGHLPVNNAFEAISANVWGMMLALALAYWRIKLVRPAAAVALPVVFLLMGWMMLIPNHDSMYPPSYDTIWLIIHIVFYKFFLGFALVALGVSSVILMRHFDIWADRFNRMPGNDSLDNLSYRFMALCLIFNTLGIIAGAIWAQDAWGRYWAWDPLETWSFLTWLFIVFSLHLRVTWKISVVVNALMTIAVFVIAFLTFFGIPFISKVVHQGAI